MTVENLMTFKDRYSHGIIISSENIMIANCNHDSDSQHYNIMIVVDGYYEHAQIKDSS